MASSSDRIRFPWERRGGFLRVLELGRLRPALVVLAAFGFLIVVALREQHRSGVRQTRATLLSVRRAIDEFRADNDGGCPSPLEKAMSYGNFKAPPTDAWGHPLRFVCPGRHPGADYELSSDGPDGEPGGVDRIE
jgi:hypothetical protein